MTRVAQRFSPHLLFVALAVGINLLVIALAREATGARAHAVAVGAVLDMTVTVPALYYFLVARRTGRGLAGVGLIALLSLWRAAFAFPDVVPGKAWIGAGVECLALAAVAVGIRRMRHNRADSDPAAAIRAAVRGMLPFPAVERAVSGELSVLYYGLAWSAKPHVEEGSAAFTLHVRSGIQDIFLFVGLASLLEIVPVHLVLAHWSTTAAWAATGLSLYGAFWAVAMSRAFALRPTLISEREIRLRFGLLAELRIPVEAIASVRAAIPADAAVFPRRTAPKLFVRFTRPLELEKLMGLRSLVTGIAVSADQGAAFEHALRAAATRA